MAGALTGAPGVVAALVTAAAHSAPNAKTHGHGEYSDRLPWKIGIISRMLPRLLQIFALSLGLSACSLMAPKFNRPNVTVIGIEMRGGNLLQQNFAVKLNIQNPNDRALPVRGLHTELRVGGEQIASGVSDHAVVIPAFGESEFDMTITANLALALLKLTDKANQHADSIDYDLTGAASIDLPFLRNLPFHQSGTLKLPGSQ
jgi:LEA14-like dessication related protein